MKKNIFLLFIMTLVLSGCYKNNKYVVAKPNNLIPENKLANIIKDMDIVQGIVNYNRTHRRDHKKDNEDNEKEYYQTLFKHYDVTAEQVRQSITYYISLGKPMANIYDKVLEKFSIEESMLYEEQYARDNNRLDTNGMLKYQFRKHWLFSTIDSIMPYSFKPIF